MTLEGCFALAQSSAVSARGAFITGSGTERVRKVSDKRTARPSARYFGHVVIVVSCCGDDGGGGGAAVDGQMLIGASVACSVVRCPGASA